MKARKKLSYYEHWVKVFFVNFLKFSVNIILPIKTKISLNSVNFLSKNITEKKKFRDSSVCFSKNIDYQQKISLSNNFIHKIEIDCIPFGNVFFQSAFSTNFCKINKNQEHFVESAFNSPLGIIDFKRIILINDFNIKKGDIFSTILKFKKINFFESYFIKKTFFLMNDPEKIPEAIIPIFYFYVKSTYEKYLKNHSLLCQNKSFINFYKVGFRILLTKKSSIRVTFGPEFRYNNRAI